MVARPMPVDAPEISAQASAMLHLDVSLDEGMCGQGVRCGIILGWRAEPVLRLAVESLRLWDFAPAFGRAVGRFAAGHFTRLKPCA